MHEYFLKIIVFLREHQAVALVVVLFVFLLLKQHRTAKLLKENMKKRSDMVALLSHRLRTPLGAIRWSSEMLLDTECGTLTLDQRELVDKMNTSIVDAISVLDLFLEGSRFARGEFSSKPQAVDVWQVVMNVVQSLQSEIQKKEIHVEVEQSFAHTFVHSDPILIHTALDVILSNAIRYNLWKGHIWVTGREEQGKMIVDVRDSGLGISSDDQPHIFERFFRTADARKMEPNGNGLGLSLVRDILKTIGGSISYTSVKGQGSTFTITLPKRKVEK
jgi:two-component system phosphate regulon sensor histidine kinase PhoR